MRLRVSASQTTRTVVARMYGAQPVYLRWNPEMSSNTGEMLIPSYVAPGKYVLTVTAEDFAHNIGTGRPMDVSPKFDTPSLRGVVYTAPYLHDGSAETLPEIFTKRDPQKKHGKAQDLNAGELADLVEFLRGL